jgi:hypothetical protein
VRRVPLRVAFSARGAPCGSAHRCLPGGRQAPPGCPAQSQVDRRRGCHDRSRRRNRRPDHRRSESAIEARGTAAVKGASLGGRLTRRDEPARCKNDEDAGRNSNGSSRSFYLRCQRTPTLFRLIRRSQGASCSDLLSQSSLLEWLPADLKNRTARAVVNNPAAAARLGR